MIEISPHNVVCGGSVGTEVPLERVAKFEGAEYNPAAFPGVQFHLAGATVMVFATGKVVVVGALTEEAAFQAMDMLVDLCEKRGVELGTITRKVSNVVATAFLGGGIDLGQVVKTTPRSLYEPEHFPGVIIRREHPKCTILLFASGKLVCVGANSVDAASSGVNQLYMDLKVAGLV